LEFVSLLSESLEYPMVVLAAPGREAAWGRLAAAIPAGKGGVLNPLPLEEAMAVTAASRALVTVDGGLMHTAVAMGVPTLALFGPTDPVIWFPYEAAGPYRVLATAPHCHPCGLHDCPDFICLPDLEPGVVLDSLVDLLGLSEPLTEVRP
jgi:ADP-heptose:LPS heptosyltransferase